MKKKVLLLLMAIVGICSQNVFAQTEEPEYWPVVFEEWVQHPWSRGEGCDMVVSEDGLSVDAVIGDVNGTLQWRWGSFFNVTHLSDFGRLSYIDIACKYIVIEFAEGTLDTWTNELGNMKMYTDKVYGASYQATGEAERTYPEMSYFVDATKTSEATRIEAVDGSFTDALWFELPAAFNEGTGVQPVSIEMNLEHIGENIGDVIKINSIRYYIEDPWDYYAEKGVDPNSIENVGAIKLNYSIANNQIVLEGLTEDMSVEIYDVVGRQLSGISSVAGNKALPISANGISIVKVAVNNSAYSFKVLNR